MSFATQSIDMHRKRVGSSLSTPIVLSSVTVALSVGLLVAWIYVIVNNFTLTKHYVENTWLLVGGIVSLVTIIAVLVLFSIFLAREILEVRRQTSFIDSVTHELKSPLAAIRLCLETLDRHHLDATQQQRLHGMMLDDVERLNTLIDAILEATRVEYGAPVPSKKPVRLQELVQRCIDLICKRHKISADEMHNHIDPTLEIYSDAASLEIVIKNLIDNAIKYSDPPHRVTFKAQCDPSHRVVITLRDEGIGIDPRYCKRIFQRFYRVPHERVRARRGTGLGLYVVSAIIRNLGGKLQAHSEGHQKGSTFTISLPQSLLTSKSHGPKSLPAGQAD